MKTKQKSKGPAGQLKARVQTAQMKSSKVCTIGKDARGREFVIFYCHIHSFLVGLVVALLEVHIDRRDIGIATMQGIAIVSLQYSLIYSPYKLQLKLIPAAKKFFKQNHCSCERNVSMSMNNCCLTPSFSCSACKGLHLFMSNDR